jgi:hypothetical protein
VDSQVVVRRTVLDILIVIIKIIDIAFHRPNSQHFIPPLVVETTELMFSSCLVCFNIIIHYFGKTVLSSNSL